MYEETSPAPDLTLKHLPEIAQAYSPEMYLLDLAKLNKESGWDRVVPHSIVQALIARQLGIWLQLPITDLDQLIQVSLCHDWEKALEHNPELFTPDEKAEAYKVMTKLNLNEQLMSVTGIEFIKKYKRGETVWFLEKLQYYIDEIVDSHNIVPLKVRQAELKARKKDLDDDKDLTGELGGMKYWDLEAKLGSQVEQEIFDALRAHGIIIDQPSDAPSLLATTILKQF